MTEGKVSVAVLVRVSTVKQETARQISELQQYAVGKGYQVLAPTSPGAGSTATHTVR